MIALAIAGSLRDDCLVADLEDNLLCQEDQCVVAYRRQCTIAGTGWQALGWLQDWEVVAGVDLQGFSSKKVPKMVEKSKILTCVRMLDRTVEATVNWMRRYGIASLAPYNLAKAEKLQIFDLGPTLPVELYVIVEELEERFGDQINKILEHVQASLTTGPKESTSTNGINSQTSYMAVAEASVVVQEDKTWDEDADAIYDEEIFDGAA
ncbi:hypothetical protein BDN70DRAFT_981646 [Pholiota conissans]|uniref:DNA-directed RNA polymerase III subunit RPC9 n=1 Tax=Pholiota conissans TaxID=109636 RepID=A0A9P6CSM5_9AGAR|nr:hypothetical protein BDN70DRAFT_981646 [Pholiota conissans]